MNLEVLFPQKVNKSTVITLSLGPVTNFNNGERK
jgi:hypothetical protein